MASDTLTSRPSWRELQSHFQQIEKMHLREMFEQDGERGSRFRAEAAGLSIDFSKHRITAETISSKVIDRALTLNSSTSTNGAKAK